MKVLIIEDDKDVAEYIVHGLQESKISADISHDGESGLEKALKNNYDVVIIDRMLPLLEGLEVIRKLRESGSFVPILILSALSDVDDRIKGLSMGGDDYLVKPYAFSELLARIHALTRRYSPDFDNMILENGDLRLDRLKRIVTRSGVKINLQPREFRLLECLIENVGQVVTRQMLFKHVWNYHFVTQTNVIDVHISRLRRKINTGFSEQLISTERGIGYILERK